ncbi:MAG: toll/interleukin-1 receptor domain-containing protein [Chloroflexota bacterium]
MQHIFISYSKQDIGFARHLRGLLQDQGFPVWMDETKLVSSEKWWPTIEQNIIACGAFIVIMSPNSRESDWVEREILVAEDRNHKRPIFPVLLAGRAWTRLGNVQYEDMSAGTKATLSLNFVDKLRSHVPTMSGQTVPPQLPVDPNTASRPTNNQKSGCSLEIKVALIGAAAVIIAALIAIIPPLINRTESPTVTPTQTAIVVAATIPTSTATATYTSTSTATDLPTKTLSPTVQASATPGITLTPTLDIVYMVQTVDTRNTAIAYATNLVAIATARSQLNAQQTAAFVSAPTATATVLLPTPVPTISVTNTTLSYPCAATITTSGSPTLNVVRLFADNSAPLEDPVQAGLIVKIVQKKEVSGTRWYHISELNSDNYLGWIPAEYIDLSGLCPN